MISEMAELAARHKLIPFLGAGVSSPMLGVDWNAITKDLADQIGLGDAGLDNPTVAQRFVDQEGKRTLCDFLGSKFKIEKFDDEKGIAHLLTLCLNTSVIYTTNQDNVFEACCDKYGRSIRPIVTLEDLSDSSPAERLYIKYHGDLGKPDTVVFTQTDYQARIADTTHPLNIRLKADLLARSLFFIGYSFRDVNIQGLFAELKTAFGDRLPSSYLLAWTNSDELERLCAAHGIKVIDPNVIAPAAASPQEAFVTTFKRLIDEIAMIRIQHEQSHFFQPAPFKRRVITSFEIEMLERLSDSDPLDGVIDTFRRHVDQALIPKDQEKRVTELLMKLCLRCQNQEQTEDLSGAAFNIQLTDAENQLNVVAALMTTARLRKDSVGLGRAFLPHVRGFPEDYYIVAVSRAIELMTEWKFPITDQLRSYITSWVDQSVLITEFDPDLQTLIKKNIDLAWQGPTTFEHPIKRQLRLGHQLARPKPFREIHASLLKNMPATTTWKRQT